MEQKLIDLIAKNVRQIETEQGVRGPSSLDADTALFGSDGFLDSMSLVTLIVSIEQAIEDEFGASISLADARAMSQQRSPYRTIASLAAYAGSLLQPAN